MFTTLRSLVPESIRARLRRVRAGVLSIGLPRYAEFEQPQSEIDASAEISIVIPIHDEQEELLTRCFRSLEKYATKAEIILVDDGSKLFQTLGIIERFSGQNEWKVIRHSESKGHSRASENGARLATRKYLCLLNSDTVTTPWSWQAAKQAFESDSRIGITGPTTSYMSTPQVARRAEYCRFYWNDSQIHAFARRLAGGRPPKCWVDLSEVGGFAFFIRRSLWEELGGFDPGLPDYGNEIELCRRASRKGWRIVWTTNSYIHHFGHQSYLRELGYEEIRLRGKLAQQYIDKKFCNH